jgi:hypothetical protein
LQSIEFERLNDNTLIFSYSVFANDKKLNSLIIPADSTLYGRLNFEILFQGSGIEGKSWAEFGVIDYGPTSSISATPSLTVSSSSVDNNDIARSDEKTEEKTVSSTMVAVVVILALLAVASLGFSIYVTFCRKTGDAYAREKSDGISNP